MHFVRAWCGYIQQFEELGRIRKTKLWLHILWTLVMAEVYFILGFLPVYVMFVSVKEAATEII